MQDLFVNANNMVTSLKGGGQIDSLLAKEDTYGADGKARNGANIGLGEAWARRHRDDPFGTERRSRYWPGMFDGVRAPECDETQLSMDEARYLLEVVGLR